jgi:hypothetical protein
LYKNKKTLRDSEAFFNFYFEVGNTYLSSLTSTRLLVALPAAVVLDLIGVVSPKPTDFNLSESTPLFVRYPTTLDALSSESF